MTLKKQVNAVTRKRLVNWLDIVSRRLIKVIVILLVTLLLAQLAIQNDYIRLVLSSADRWEGTRLN
ncbi:hypothetical protein [Paenibacillus sp. PAMC21692]|uniref:hypothetical protein n=1 Tax=Paenibacillus sp. PAMC21692 TaxID=2762320 RepID=UPI00164EA24A|nr:hypothetical protein [Paenibacillus sp. PAMC21692]QNK55388.1 hypothetical protein H7F31_22595 [Paenibacillus sp. PAMC21692]